MQKSWERWESRPAGKMISADLLAVGRRRPRVYGLRTFADPGCPVDFCGAFRDNIRAFIQECAEIEDQSLRGTTAWCTLLVDEKSGAVIPFYVVEEHVTLSPHPLCDHCRCAGWSHHFVSRRRYHLIIPSDDDWDRTSLRPDAFEQQTHILHGLVHCNGFGHLLRLNGRDGGSHFVAGRDVMDLWDRLCTALRVREITVEDSSRWRSMDLRLLLGVAHGTTWFGRWGYTLRTGSFGTAQKDYQRSVDLLGSHDLDRLIEEFQSMGREGERLHRIVLGYRRIAKASPCGPQRLQSVSDLLRFLLDFRSRRTAAAAAQAARPEKKARNSSPPPESLSLFPFLPAVARRRAPVSPQKRRRSRDFDAVAEDLDSRWPVRRLKVAAQVIVDALEQRPAGMTRQEVRDAARLTIGDTGLLDFVLKSIGDCVVGGRVVRRCHNPATRVLEFSLEGLPGERGEIDPNPAPTESPPEQFSRHLVERDIAWVYRHLLLGIRPEAAEMALHCKRWGKSWDLRDEEDDRLRFLCGWMPSEAELAGGRLTRPLPPPEVLVLPPHATVGDLRVEAEKAMRDTYCIMEAFRATAVEGVAGEDGDPLFGCGAESGARVWVRGHGVSMGATATEEEEDEEEEDDLRDGPAAERPQTLLLYEGGAESWKVRCVCGARDDDGERMVACDICEVWQHTRCVGIAEGAAVPPLFLCAACGTTVLRHTTTTTTAAKAG